MLVPAVGKVNRVHLPVAGEEPAPEPSTCATINLYLSRTLQNFAPSATKRSRQLVSFCQSRRTIPTDSSCLSQKDRRVRRSAGHRHRTFCLNNYLGLEEQSPHALSSPVLCFRDCVDLYGRPGLGRTHHRHDRWPEKRPGHCFRRALCEPGQVPPGQSSRRAKKG